MRLKRNDGSPRDRATLRPVDPHQAVFMRHIQWDPEDENVVRKLWGTMSAKEIAPLIGRSPAAVRNLARRLELPKIDQETQFEFFREAMRKRGPFARDGEFGEQPSKHPWWSERRRPLPTEDRCWCDYWNDRRLRKQHDYQGVSNFYLRSAEILAYLQSCGWIRVRGEERYHLFWNPEFPYETIMVPNHAAPRALMSIIDRIIDLLSDLTGDPAHLIWMKIKNASLP